MGTNARVSVLIFQGTVPRHSRAKKAGCCLGDSFVCPLSRRQEYDARRWGSPGFVRPLLAAALAPAPAASPDQSRATARQPADRGGLPTQFPDLPVLGAIG